MNSAINFVWTLLWVAEDPCTVARREVLSRYSVTLFRSVWELAVRAYLFDADFCNVTSSWEKGIVEKNAQDSRRRIWLNTQSRQFNFQ